MHAVNFEWKRVCGAVHLSKAVINMEQIIDYIDYVYVVYI